MIFHVGFNKTATTTIQNNLFDKHSGIVNVGKPDFMNSELLMQLNQDIKKKPDHEYDEDKIKIQFDSILSSLDSKNKIIVWSEENFTSNPFNVERNASRILALHSNSKILFTIRNQLDYLQSLYFVALNRAYARNDNEEIMSMNAWLDKNWERLSRRVNFYDVIKYYSELFGKENIGVFYYEHFVNSREQYINDLSEFMGVDSEESFSIMADSNVAEYRPRLTNVRAAAIKWSSKIPVKNAWRIMPEKLRSTLRTYINKGEKAEAVLSSDLKNKIELIISESNTLLEKEFGLDLEKYGYLISN